MGKSILQPAGERCRMFLVQNCKQRVIECCTDLQIIAFLIAWLHVVFVENAELSVNICKLVIEQQCNCKKCDANWKCIQHISTCTLFPVCVALIFDIHTHISFKILQFSLIGYRNFRMWDKSVFRWNFLFSQNKTVVPLKQSMHVMPCVLSVFH